MKAICSETSLNRTLRKSALSEYRPILKSLLNNSSQKKSQKTSHPSMQANYFGPSAGRFREVYADHWSLKTISDV
jgi:hypothetical protein